MVSQGFSSILFPLTTSDPWIYFLTNGTWTYLGFFVCLCFIRCCQQLKLMSFYQKQQQPKKPQNRLPSSLENSTTSWWVLRSSRSWLAAFVCFTGLTFQAPTQGPRLGTGQATDDVDADPERKTHLIRAEGGREQGHGVSPSRPSSTSWIRYPRVLGLEAPRPTYRWEAAFPISRAAQHIDSVAPGNPRPRSNPRRWPEATPRMPWSWCSRADDKRHRCRGCPSSAAAEGRAPWPGTELMNCIW